MKISKETAAHYVWGDHCDGWRLVNGQDLSIIHEKMPPGTSESRHYHQKARQFFFILAGQAVIDVNGERFELAQHEGIEVPPQIPHQIFNSSKEAVEFLVISQPSTVGDRIQIQA
jgi:mannose-6-phosphate isomerase-like protein (cupin superfamily)